MPLRILRCSTPANSFVRCDTPQLRRRKSLPARFLVEQSVLSPASFPSRSCDSVDPLSARFYARLARNYYYYYLPIPAPGTPRSDRGPISLHRASTCHSAPGRRVAATSTNETSPFPPSPTAPSPVPALFVRLRRLRGSLHQSALLLITLTPPSPT